MAMSKIYLAGPDVFLPDAVEIGQAKQRLCAKYGLEGLSPSDSEIGDGSGDLSGAIFRACLAMMNQADLVIANLTPFRGVSADSGTVFELGYAFALGKPVLGYSNLPGTLLERVAGHLGAEPTRGPDGRLYGIDRMAIEDFGQVDNLMIAEAIRADGCRIVVPAVPVADPLRDLGAFETCLVALAGLTQPPARD
jgi:nucleoside 2-deoxyribosyltransferase